MTCTVRLTLLFTTLPYRFTEGMEYEQLMELNRFSPSLDDISAVAAKKFITNISKLHSYIQHSDTEMVKPTCKENILRDFAILTIQVPSASMALLKQDVAVTLADKIASLGKQKRHTYADFIPQLILY